MENFEHTSTPPKEDFKVMTSSNEVQILNAKLLQAKKDHEALQAQYVESRDECAILQKKLDMVRDQLTTWGPEFLRRLCEANEEMCSNPFWEPLPAVGEFMSLCEYMASGLKRKRDGQ